MTPIFRYVLKLTLRAPVVVLLLAAFSVVLCLGITAQRLTFSTDRTQLLDPEHPVQKGYRAFREEFGGNNDLIVLVMGNPERVRAATDDLGALLTADTGTFQEVFYKLELPEVARHALYFLSLSDLRDLMRQATVLPPWLPAMEKGLPGLVQGLSKQNQTEALTLLEPLLPNVADLLEGAVRSLDSRGEDTYRSLVPVFLPESPRLQGAAFEPGQTTFYNTIGNSSICMLIAQPRDTSGSFTSDSATIARLRQHVTEVMRAHPRVDCLVSGEPVLNTDEMVGARDDAVKCSIAALLLVSLILAMAFRDAIRPLCAVVSLLVGLSWAFAFAALTVGTLNLLTVHFATILMGLSMTFAIQLLSHFQSLRSVAAERSARDCLEEAVCETGLQTLIGAVSTALAFWTLNFTSFRAAGELGLITGTGVLFTFTAIWVIFPLLIDLTEGQRPAHPLYIPGFAQLGRSLYAHPWRVLAVSLLVTLYSATWLNGVPFNYNVLSMQAKGSEAVRVEDLLQSLGYSTLHAVATAPNLEDAIALTRRLEALPTVAHVESIATLLPRDVEQKRAPIERILQVVRQVDALPQLDSFLASGERYRSAEELLKLQSLFLQSSGRLDLLFQALPQSPDRQRLLAAYGKLKRSLESGSPGPLEAGLRIYERDVFAEMSKYHKFLRSQQSSPPNMLASLPEALRKRSISKEGNFSLRVFPRANCWEREPLGKFVAELEKVDPKISGTPLLIFHYLEELRLAYSSAGRNALLVIAFLLLLHYRSFSQAGLALFPKLLGVVWMLGVMGLAKVSFNPANFLALPIILGIGLVFGVNILAECRDSQSRRDLFASATGGAVFLSGLVATTGFACFTLANHVGVNSFGFVMAAGVGANLITSLVTLPAVLEVWHRLIARFKRA